MQHARSGCVTHGVHMPCIHICFPSTRSTATAISQAARAAGLAPTDTAAPAEQPAAAAAARAKGAAAAKLAAAPAAADGGGAISGVAAVVAARLIAAKCVQQQLEDAKIDFRKKFRGLLQQKGEVGSSAAAAGGRGAQGGIDDSGSESESDGDGEEEEGPGDMEVEDEGVEGVEGEEEEEEEVELDEVALGALDKLLRKR